MSLDEVCIKGELDKVKSLIENGANVHAVSDYALRSVVYKGRLEISIFLKKIYSERYKDKFLCYNCLVLAACNKLCSNIILRK